MKPTTFYLTASSANKGALSIFLAYGGEEDLARALDARVGGRAACTPSNPLSINELRYGWLRTGGEGGEVLDEVMLACPAPGRRVLMTHGGGLIRNQAAAYFAANSFHEITFEPDRIAPLADPLLDVLLASCRTEGQAAAVLAARAGGGDRAGLARLLAPRRVVLAGAPNAGKSSLLNALAGYDRAFVDPEAGATRDGVDELVALSGWSVWLGDTPGYGGAGEGLEGEAWRRAGARLRLAEEIWFVADGSEAWGPAAESAASAVAALIGGEGEGGGGGKGRGKGVCRFLSSSTRRIARSAFQGNPGGSISPPRGRCSSAASRAATPLTRSRSMSPKRGAFDFRIARG